MVEHSNLALRMIVLPELSTELLCLEVARGVLSEEGFPKGLHRYRSMCVDPLPHSVGNWVILCDWFHGEGPFSVSVTVFHAVDFFTFIKRSLSLSP